MTPDPTDPLRLALSDARHLEHLAQLRVGRRTDHVQLQVRRGDRVDVFYAPGGQFMHGAGGRWHYRDELGRDWGPVDHDRVARAFGRLPYGHRVASEPVLARGAQQKTEHYVRDPLERARINDRRPRRNRGR